MSSACFNVTLRSSLRDCIQGKCNFTEPQCKCFPPRLWTTLTEVEIASFHSNLRSSSPVESQVETLIIVVLICGLLALIAIALWIYSRYTIANSLGADDWTLIAATAPFIALTVLQVIGIQSLQTENAKPI
jgi:hypothetical protein